MTIPRVSQLFEAIRAAHAELAAIRANCPHESFTPVWWSWGAGRISPVRRCDRCGDAIPGITAEEAATLGPLSGSSAPSYSPE